MGIIAVMYKHSRLLSVKQRKFLKLISFPILTRYPRLDSKILMTKKLYLKPLEVIRDSIRWTENIDKLAIRLGNEIIADGKSLIIECSLKNPNLFDWNSEYGLFLKAKDFMNQRK